MPPGMALYYIPASPRSFVIAAPRKIEKPVRFGGKKRKVGGGKYHHDLFSRAHFLLK